MNFDLPARSLRVAVRTNEARCHCGRIARVRHLPVEPCGTRRDRLPTWCRSEMISVSRRRACVSGNGARARESWYLVIAPSLLIARLVVPPIVRSALYNDVKREEERSSDDPTTIQLTLRQRRVIVLERVSRSSL